jgi:phospholipase/lecithinase/hemolysin
MPHSFPRRAVRALAPWLLLVLVALLPLGSTALAATAPRFGTLLVFGDSYSVRTRGGVRNWPLQLQAANDVRILADLAFGGATAEPIPGPRSTFQKQVDGWLGPLGGRAADVTVVYFGYNDVRSSRPLAAAKAGYSAQVDRLIRAGATRGTRRLLLATIHDISRNPATRGLGRARVLEWNRHVAAVARARAGVEVVDLFALFEGVFARPALYGLKNVRTVDSRASATTALFFDDFHFGARGHGIIASGIRSQLARPSRSYELLPAAAR